MSFPLVFSVPLKHSDSYRRFHIASQTFIQKTVWSDVLPPVEVINNVSRDERAFADAGPFISLRLARELCDNDARWIRSFIERRPVEAGTARITPVSVSPKNQTNFQHCDVSERGPHKWTPSATLKREISQES